MMCRKREAVSPDSVTSDREKERPKSVNVDSNNGSPVSVTTVSPAPPTSKLFPTSSASNVIIPTPINPLHSAHIPASLQLPLPYHVIPPTNGQAPLPPPSLHSMFSHPCLQLLSSHFSQPVFSLANTTNWSMNRLTSLSEEILLACVTWARMLPAFSSLEESDKRALFEATWAELFVLIAAEKGFNFDANSLVPSIDQSRDEDKKHSFQARTLTLYSQLQEVKDIIQSFHLINVDPTEWSCLRSIVLFRYYTRGLRSTAEIQRLQEKAHLTLMSHCARAYPTDVLRNNRLLLLLPRIRDISANTIRTAFFKNSSMQDVSIERLLADLVHRSN